MNNLDDFSKVQIVMGVVVVLTCGISGNWSKCRELTSAQYFSMGFGAAEQNNHGVL